MAGLRIRALELDDVELMYDIENDTSLWHLGSANVPYSHLILRDFVMNTTGDIYTDKQARLVIENDDRHVVGMVDLTDFSPKNLRAEVGIVILSEFQGYGYATEAIRQIGEYAKEVLQLKQLYAYIDVDNEKCKRAFHNNGYQAVATIDKWMRQGDLWRDVVMMQKIF